MCTKTHQTTAAGDFPQPGSTPPPQGNGGNAETMANMKPCDEGYRVAVIVKTRLGGFPIPGLTVKIKGKPDGTTKPIVDGTGCDAEYYLTAAPCFKDQELELSVSYGNAAAGMLQEKVTMTIKDISYKDMKATLHKVENKIALVQDVLGDAHDKDYHEVIERGAKAPADYDEEVKAGTANKTVGFDGVGDLAGKVRFQVDGKKKILKVDMYLATFSLKAAEHYISQVYQNECIYIEGNHSDGDKYVVRDHGCDKSHVVHDIPKKVGKGNVWGAAGHSLCCPTSVTMLFNYLGVVITRTELLVRFIKYDNRPTDEKFKDLKHPWQLTDVITGRSNQADMLGSNFKASAGTDISGSLLSGIPIVRSIMKGHIILVIGGVINRNGAFIRYIANDPMGTLAHSTANYGIAETAPNWYRGGARNTNNVADTKGRHVYYRIGAKGTRSRSSQTVGARFSFREGSNIRVTKTVPFTRPQIIEHIISGD